MGSADVHELLIRLSHGHKDFRVYDALASGLAAIEKIATLSVDLVVLDLDLPDVCGIVCARRLLASCPRLKTVLVAPFSDPAFTECAFDAGISGFLVRPLNLRHAEATLQFVASALDPHKPVTKLPRLQSGCVLSAREEQVLALLGDGYLYKEIADRLNISNSVLKKLQHRIFQKLHAQNRTEAVRNRKALGCAPSV